MTYTKTIGICIVALLLAFAAFLLRPTGEALYENVSLSAVSEKETGAPVEALVIDVKVPAMSETVEHTST